MDQNEVQKLIVEAQSYQQQLQMVMSQKEALNMQLIESGKALQELSKAVGDNVYKITGPVLIKVKSADAKKHVEEKKDLAMLRIKTLEKSESGLKGKLEDIKEKLQKAGL